MKTLKIRLAWVVLLFVWVSLFVCAECWGANWKFVGKDDEGSVWEIDVASISRQPNNIVRVWEKITDSKKSVTNRVKKFGEKYKDFSHSMDLMEYHCTEKKIRILSLAHYSLDGGIIYSGDYPGEWSFIIPDSIAETIFEEVCKQPE